MNKAFPRNSPSFDLHCFCKSINTGMHIEDLCCLAKTRLSLIINDIKENKKANVEQNVINDKLNLIFKDFKNKMYIFRMWALIGFKY